MCDSTKTRALRRFAITLACACVVLTNAAQLFACSVCQGNPDSKLVKGAEAGVLLMVFVTYGLLLGMIGLGATWFVRQRRHVARIASRGSHREYDPTNESQAP
jgi:hypothetical protein